jgi:serine/threonine protein kinase
MRAPEDPSDMSAIASRFVGITKLALADPELGSVQRPQAAFETEQRHEDSQSIDCATIREHVGLSASPFVDDAPTDQLLRGSRRRPIEGEIRPELVPGSALRSRYVLEDVIGRGGYSILYRARDRHRATPHDNAANFIAVKLLRPDQIDDPLTLTRLMREFQQMQGLSHPGIVRVFDLDCDGDVWFITMELVAGQTVKSWIETPGAHANAMRVISGCCEALDYAHSLGVLHGDLKPTNVMVTADGAAKVIDFGSAPNSGVPLAAEPDPTAAATPLYASPQVLAGKAADRRDDVYSLACLSYYILSRGRHPFGGRPSLEDGRAKSAPSYVRTIPIAVFSVIERGLSAERERRPASVREFLQDLTDAERHRVAVPALDAVESAPDPGSVVQAIDKPRSPSAGLINGRPRSWRLLKTKTSGIASASLDTSADGIGRDSSPYRRTQPWVIFLAVSIAGAAGLYPIGTPRDAIPAPLPRYEAPVAAPEVAATDTAPTELTPETPPVVHNSGVISFEASTVYASPAQSLVALSVKRLSATNGRGAFLWRVEGGSAQPGVDYEPVEPQLVKFTDGQAARTLFIPLISAPSTTSQRGPRTFTVELEQVRGGPALGRFARVTVTIDPTPVSSPGTVYEARAEP